MDVNRKRIPISLTTPTTIAHAAGSTAWKNARRLSTWMDPFRLLVLWHQPSSQCERGDLWDCEQWYSAGFPFRILIVSNMPIASHCYTTSPIFKTGSWTLIWISLPYLPSLDCSQTCAWLTMTFAVTEHLLLYRVCTSIKRRNQSQYGNKRYESVVRYQYLLAHLNIKLSHECRRWFKMTGARKLHDGAGCPKQ